ncbi:SMP-30/gluconolactonase/LRE family protein [Brevundimonas sp. AJA228-03]|uniref:SMP-30/gluconolactonase/LRE family protein n=1 Tax=Brevundimonas sp. AJA228-03 TaxID=2752515 RepID=UPI001AE0C3F2|nr:SMP-30/gluconolactonase/LRE family protein [Brevundimonas sp. AJA228-03]QTN20455.1 SMP-30/gluconolactonase/LRE family protein [Brevundimonas sp. AJA228-03]
MSEPELVWDLGAELGEGPVWDAPRRAVWFVDIKGRKLHRYGVDDDAKASWETPEQTGFALPAEDGSLVCGVRGGLHRFDPESGQFDLIVRVEEDRPQNRLNDGFVAPDGSLWFGSMDDTEATVSGALYRFHNGKVERHDDGYRVTNGPAMSPDGRTLYHHDTTTRRIFAFDHKDGVLTNKRLFAETTDGFSDGPSVDAEGVLHVGLFNGWGVARFSPSGERIGTIRFPVQTVTKAAFGGDDLRDLYCTTAWLNNADKRTEQPGLGGLFRVRVDTPGLPQHRVRL